LERVNLKVLLERLASVAKEALAADAAAVFLEEPPRPLAPVGTAGFADGIPDGVGAPEEAARRGETIQGETEDLPGGLRTVVCVPLPVPGRPRGSLCVYRREPRPFAPSQVSCLAALAELGGIAIGALQDLAEQERIEAAKSRFIHVATHELRSPIAVAQSLIRNVVRGYAGPLTETQKDLFARISARLDFLEHLVNDLLDLAASRAPELAEEECAVALNSSVGRAVLLLMPRAEEKGVNLVARPYSEELAVWGTEEGLDRIFVNLIENGIKYTPPGGTVTVTMGRDGDEVWVRVADTGIGIPPEAMPHLFEEFYRAPNARAVNAVGTGLGLTIVKELVERYRGRIEVESQVGKGTTFTVTFPAAGSPTCGF